MITPRAIIGLPCQVPVPVLQVGSGSCQGDPVRQMPGRFLSDPQVGCHLHRTAALRIGHDQAQAEIPRLRTRPGALQHRVTEHREMAAAVLAPVRHPPSSSHRRHTAPVTVRRPDRSASAKPRTGLWRTHHP